MCCVLLFAAGNAEAAVEKVRAMYRDNPATSFVVGWDQVSGSGAELCVDTVDNGDNAALYTNCTAPDRVESFRAMENTFVRLNDLDPKTNYYFVIKDSEGATPRYYVQTAPDQPEKFTYVTGGDTKSTGSSYIKGQDSNKMVAKLRPLFVLFTGDMNSDDGTNVTFWSNWLDDWSSQTTTADGRLIPLLAVHGNHENGDFTTINKIFDTPDVDSEFSYYSMNFGGDLLHVISLNSELQNGNAPAGSFAAQTSWLEADLIANQDSTFKIAGYHKPMRPHTSSKSEQTFLQQNWAPLFDTYGLTVGCESDSHMHKVTFPLSYCTGGAGCFQNFVRDDKMGVMYVGEGSWGANPRDSDDNKPWTINSRSINQIKWHTITPDDPATIDVDESKLEIRTIITTDEAGTEKVSGVEALTEANKYSKTPENISLAILPFFGETMTMPFEAPVGDIPSAPINLEAEVLSFTEINVTWDNVSGTDTAANIELQMKEGVGPFASFESIAFLPADATSFKVIQLKAGETYTFQARALNLFGPSDTSTQSVVSIPVDTRKNVSFMHACNQDGICFDPLFDIIAAPLLGLPDCPSDFFNSIGQCVAPVPDLYIGTVDAGIFESAPDFSDDGTDIGFIIERYEGYPLMSSDNNSGVGDREEILIRFNGFETQIPETAVIDQALLRMYTGDETNNRLAVHRMLIDWPAKPTWNTFGGEGIETNDVMAALDADDSESGNIPFAAPVFFDVTESVKAWVEDPSKNYGVVILNSGSNGWETPQSEFFGTFDGNIIGVPTILQARPQLTVFYTVPGDVNDDDFVDMSDLMILRSFNRQPASACPECDVNEDGVINGLDIRKMFGMCTLPRCASQE
jgi:hypothetical protein